MLRALERAIWLPALLPGLPPAPHCYYYYDYCYCYCYYYYYDYYYYYYDYDYTTTTTTSTTSTRKPRQKVGFFGKNCQLARVQALSEPEPAAAGAAAACVQSVGWRASDSGTKSTETQTRRFWAAVAWRPNDRQHQPATTQRRQTETHTSRENMQRQAPHTGSPCSNGRLRLMQSKKPKNRHKLRGPLHLPQVACRHGKQVFKIEAAGKGLPL